MTSTLERAGIPPRSEPSPEEPVEFVAWTGFPPRAISPQDLNEGAPPPSVLPPKGKVQKKRSA